MAATTHASAYKQGNRQARSDPSPPHPRPPARMHSTGNAGMLPLARDAGGLATRHGAAACTMRQEEAIGTDRRSAIRKTLATAGGLALVIPSVALADLPQVIFLCVRARMNECMAHTCTREGRIHVPRAGAGACSIRTRPHASTGRPFSRSAFFGAPLCDSTHSFSSSHSQTIPKPVTTWLVMTPRACSVPPLGT